MYQTIDDMNENENSRISNPEPVQSYHRLLLMAVMALGIGILVMIMILSKQTNTHIAHIQNNDLQAQHAYRQAIAEHEPALRRARLSDYIQTYKHHDRVPAAQAQLDVILLTESRDWASLQEVIYNPAQSRPSKLAALILYENLWRPDLLGGRQAEVDILKSTLSDAPLEIETETDSLDGDNDTKPPEDPQYKPQDFTPALDKFDTHIDGTKMAGGIIKVERMYIPPPVKPDPIKPIDKVIEPTLRKNVKPRYPSRALRKGIEAEIVLSLTIDINGQVKSAEPIHVNAENYQKNFIKAARKAALKTRYNPKTVNDKPVIARNVVKKYTFRIKG